MLDYGLQEIKVCLWSQWDGWMTYLSRIYAFSFFCHRGFLHSNTLLVDLGVLHGRFSAWWNICRLLDPLLLNWCIRALTVVRGVIGLFILHALSWSVNCGGSLLVGARFWSFWGFCCSLGLAADHVLLQNVVSVEALATFVAFKGSIWEKGVIVLLVLLAFTFPIICQILVKLSYASNLSSAPIIRKINAGSYFWWLTS